MNTAQATTTDQDFAAASQATVAATVRATGPARIAANNTVTKRLGNWTSERRFQVRAHHGVAVLDLRSPQIPAGDIEIEVDLDHSVLKVLVADDAMIDDWNLRRVGRGRVKDAERPKDGQGRRVVLSGEMRHGEIRAQRGGVALLSAMFSREYLVDLWQAHKQGGFPTVDDPTRVA